MRDQEDHGCRYPNEPRITRRLLLLLCSGYSVNVVSNAGDLKVSVRGQMSLPASARHRWGLDEGGSIGFLDVGDAIVLIPGGVDRLRSAGLDAVSDADWAAAREGFGDPEMASE